MGEAKRRKTLGLPPKKNNTNTKIQDSPKKNQSQPITHNQTDLQKKIKL